jgi:hypothetical protein
MKADPWNNTASLVERLNFALALSSNRVVGVTTDWSRFVKTTDEAPDAPDPAALAQAKEQSLESSLLHIAVSDRTRQTILAQISADPAQQEASLKQVAIKDRKRDPFYQREKMENAPIADPQSALAAGLLFGSPEFQRR